MKNLYNSEANNRKIKKFNDAKACGQHMPFVPATFMSAGTRTILWCPRQERVITLMSAGEKRAYYCFIFAPNVVYVKEQYPLDYVKTQRIADKHGVIHPRDHETGEVSIMTTDFLVGFSDGDGSIYKEVWAYKRNRSVDEDYDMVKKLGRPLCELDRETQKLGIAEEYWDAFGVRHKLKVDADVCKQTAYNYKMLADEYTNAANEDELHAFTDAFLSFIANFPEESLKTTLREVGRHLTSQSRPYHLFANAVLRHLLPLDVSQPIDFIEPAKLLAM